MRKRANISTQARVAVAIAATATALVACKKPDDGGKAAQLTSAPPPVSARTVKVVELPMPELLTVTGSLRASQESEVAADASGKVASTFVERGQVVKRGQTLAILDARGASITANVAAANTNLAKAQLEQAQKECDRVTALFKSGAISQAEAERTTSQCQATEWSARAAQAQQQSAQKMVGDAVIRAPFDGVIGERFVNVGQYVAPSTRIVSLYAPDPLRLELTVPEQSVAAVKPEMQVSFTVATHPDKTFQGTIRFISPNVRANTRDLVIEAVCPNSDGALRPGMFAIAKLAAGEKPMAVVPRAAVVSGASSPRVFVVEQRRVQERVVQLGGEREGNVAVIAGVKVGEMVVVTPGPDVKDGATVAGE